MSVSEYRHFQSLVTEWREKAKELRYSATEMDAYGATTGKPLFNDVAMMRFQRADAFDRAADDLTETIRQLQGMVTE